MRRRRCLAVVVSVMGMVLLVPLAATAQAPRIPRERFDPLFLSEADRGAIVHIARTLSDRPIARLVTPPRLPFGTRLVQVQFADEVFDTWVIETRLDVYNKDTPTTRAMKSYRRC